MSADSAAALLATLLPAVGPNFDLTAGPAPAVAFDPFEAGGGPARALRKMPAPPPLEEQARIPTVDELPWLSAAATAALVRSGQLTPESVRSAATARIRALDRHLGTFILLCDEDDDAVAAPTGALAGVPVAVKDMIDVAGLPTTAGAARPIAGLAAERHATCWERLRGAGARMMGKLNTQEFAAGVVGDNDHFGPVANPWSPDRVAGGSSSGAAAAVAAGLVPLTLGTDTGGSVRIPAACCGVVGFKLTYGRVPLDGVVPLAWSLDHVGPIARSVSDAALAADVLAGGRCHDAARAGAAYGLRGMRIGVPTEWTAEVTPDVATPFRAAVDQLRGLGADLVELAGLPTVTQVIAVNRVIAFAEGSAAHAALLSGGFPYGSAIKSRMTAGASIPASTYVAAQRRRREICRAVNEVWAAVDAVVSPTLPCTAPPRGRESVAIRGEDVPLGKALIRFTALANLTGQPALSLPCGQGQDGLPVGLTVMGPVGADEIVCFVAGALDAALPPLRPPDRKGTQRFSQR